MCLLTIHSSQFTNSVSDYPLSSPLYSYKPGARAPAWPCVSLPMNAKVLQSTCPPLLALLLAACSSSIGEVREFQLYDGNESLPPPAQRAIVIRGRIDSGTIILEYSRKQSSGELKQTLRIVGDDYRRALDLLQETSVHEITPGERPAGGQSFDVTLTDAKGRSIIG